MTSDEILNIASLALLAVFALPFALLAAVVIKGALFGWSREAKEVKRRTYGTLAMPEDAP